MSDITANVVVSMPSQLFTMARSFKAVANGKIYIGKIDTDPVNPENQIQVYVENEDGSHVPVSQPIIINAAGYPVYNGQIAKFVTVQGHSMAVYDAYGSQQFYFPNVLKYDPDQFSIYAQSVFKYEVYERLYGRTFSSGATLMGKNQVLFNDSDGYWYRYTGVIPVTVPPNSSPDSHWKAVGYLLGYDIRDVRNWTNDLHDALGNTIKLQVMADALGDGGEIIFPGGTTTVFNTIDIKNKNFTISGSGIIDGTIRFYKGTYLTNPDIYMNFKVSSECRFKTDRSLDAAIQLCYSRVGSISFSQCDGYVHAIRKISTTELTNPNAIGQNVNRITVSNCKYDNVDYFIKSGKSPDISFDAADWIIINNEGHALIDHVSFDSIDGVTIADNIMFFPGYQTKNGTKRSHIRIENGGGWLHIHDNKFFESGGSSVYLNKCTRFNIHDNLYAFGAQRVPVPQLVITGTPLSGDYFSQGIIHNETMALCGGEGISIGDKSGRLKVYGNNIQNPSSTAYYYGETPQPEPTGIIVLNDTIAVEVVNNTTSSGNNNLSDVANNFYKDNIVENIIPGSGVMIESTIKTLSLSSATSTIDVGPWMAVTVSVSSSFGLSVIKNSGPTKIITITNTGTSSFNIVNSQNLKLSGGTNVTLTAGSSLTLRVATGGNATEVSRAII
ncbi:phage head-binding domain-containing protein [Escherichia coli]|nr:hypothetical protein [Escherichia coli]EKR8133986.1 hypothetical protein [Escherichia coli]MED0209296.1 phage head-binding domain-containing protein [Escherichia coli]MED0264268.1 phage head-binding domain-containing protein [Escherichia coli]MED0297425.1 phage head-binding domain-containing protein [Escherichia coli]